MYYDIAITTKLPVSSISKRNCPCFTDLCTLFGRIVQSYIDYSKPNWRLGGSALPSFVILMFMFQHVIELKRIPLVAIIQTKSLILYFIILLELRLSRRVCLENSLDTRHPASAFDLTFFAVFCGLMLTCNPTISSLLVPIDWKEISRFDSVRSMFFFHDCDYVLRYCHVLLSIILVME